MPERIPSSIIDHKLTVFAQEVDAIPTEYNNLIEVWTEKVANLIILQQMLETKANERERVDNNTNASLPRKASNDYSNMSTLVFGCVDSSLASCTTSTTSSNEDDGARTSLEHELLVIEWSIKNLLLTTMHADCLGQPLELLMQKHGMLLKLIDNIPQKFEDLRQKWIEKATILKSKYPQISKDDGTNLDDDSIDDSTLKLNDDQSKQIVLTYAFIF